MRETPRPCDVVGIQGRASGHSQGRISASGVALLVRLDGSDDVAVANCIEVKGKGGPFSQPGDAGAAVLDTRKRLIGIVIASAPGTELGVTYVAPAENLLRALGVVPMTTRP